MTTITTTDFTLVLERAILEEEYVSRFAELAALTTPPIAIPSAPPLALEAVVRKYRCLDCGYRHEDGVEVTLEEAVTKPAKVVGYWCCDECGSEYWDNVRVTGKDFR